MLEKIKALFSSMTEDELTEYLKSIGIEFAEKGEQKIMYYNLVFINHGDSSKNYLFKVPMGIELKRYEQVFCNTIRGESRGTCISNSFIVDEYTAKQIISGTGAYEPLKEVTGRAVAYTDYKLERFDLARLPF